MSDPAEVIAYCHACGGAMNVTALPPFTNCACPTCGKHTRVKREFGPYTLMHRHAAGGMSMVFGAHDNTLDREVAIKILNETYSSDERRIAAFEHEAKLTASLSHPHIVKVLTTGQAFGYFYIAMEFVPGGHLEHQIRERQKIPEAEMLGLAIEIAQGLRAAHMAGLLHRDIKPGNILLDSEGHAKLVDFGLALVTQGGKVTAEEIWATPYYVPPETIEGEEEDLRSDIYAFGATLYHALSGKPSCSESSMVTEALRAAKRHVIPLRTTDPSISPETAALVDKAMAYRPEDRFQSYDELLAALTRARGIVISGHHQPSDSELRRMRLLEKRRRNQRLIIACVATVIVGFILLITVPRILRNARDKGVSTGTQSPVSGVTTSQPDSTAVELAANYSKARKSLESKQYGIATDSFAKLLGHSKFEEPSRTMAGVESILAAYLDGQPNKARQNAHAVREHLSQTKRTVLSPGLSEVISALEQQTPLPVPKSGSTSRAQDVMAAMLAGLKNWEHGMFEKAVPCFSQVTSLSLGEDDKWVAVYQNKAREYLEDLKIFSSPVFSSYPPDRASCRKARDELEVLLGKLKTRGRAPYNIRAWQEDIRRHAMLLGTTPTGNNPPPPQPSEREQLTRIREQLQSYRFSEASLAIQQLASDPAGVNRAALSSAVEAASAFLKDLQNDISKTRVTADITLRSGAKASAVSNASNEALSAQTDAGNLQIKWQDLPADSLIALHRTLVKGPLTDPETLRRHESAVWFDWLVGSRERAQLAAEKIGQSNAAFAKRWGEARGKLSGL